MRWNRMEKDVGTSAKGITADTLAVVLSMGDSVLTCAIKCPVLMVGTQDFKTSVIFLSYLVRHVRT